MPPSATARRKMRDDDSDNEDGNASSLSRRYSGSSKRARYADATTNVITSLSEALPPPSTFIARPNDLSVARNGREKMEYQPGAIVRIKLENFVTYNTVEIFPGPSLNMVIGPNGTGKSTLVCAICIGLGWDPKYMGRQKEVSEFVKMGESEASIEIELCKSYARTRNPVIRTVIKREGNSARFWVNGNITGKKQTQNLARKFSIQIDNLCQFLPQDKVVEFAAMSPVELLRSTQEAVASRQMLAWHSELKALRKDQKEHEQVKRSQDETLANLEGRQRMQEADVARMRERDQAKDNIRQWTLLKPFVGYRGVIAEKDTSEARHKEAEREYDELNESLQPTLDSTNAKAAYRDAIKVAVAGRKRDLQQADQAVKEQEQKMENINTKIEELITSIRGEKRTNGNDEKEADRLQGIINGLKGQLEIEPPEFDATLHNERIRASENTTREMLAQRNETDGSRRRLEAESKQNAHRIRRAKQDLEDLDTQAGRQVSKLQRASPDSTKLWRYIQEHPDEFEEQVFGPPIVECSVKDTRYVAQIEALFQRNQFVAFTVQTKKDFDTLSNIYQKRLRLHQITIRTTNFGIDRFSSPIPREDLQRYGLDGWALDYIDGPERVLAMLCDDLKIHQTAVALEDTTQQQYDAISASHIASWVTKKNTYKIIRRREYGPGAISTNVRDVRPANYWTDQPVDLQAKRDINRNISEWTEEQESLQGRVQECCDQGKSQVAKIEAAKQATTSLREEKERLQQAVLKFGKLPVRVAENEEALAGVQARIEEYQTRFRAILSKREGLFLEKGQTALEYATVVESLHQIFPKIQEAELMVIEASSDHEFLVEKNKTARAQLEERRAEVVKLEDVLNSVAERARAFMKECKNIKKKAVEDGDVTSLNFIKDNVEAGKTIDQIDEEITSEEARLELMQEGNGRIIEEFEDRARKIIQLKEKVQGIEGQLDKVSIEIANIRSKWEPRLDRLIKRISDSFAFNMKQINCAGDVGIDKDEDFDQWAIKIQVKFREEEALTQLDSRRQSGGERAVSTIFYLMSLQALTRAPFRVVDEINQGMDPRNERLVHSRMVAIATGNDVYEENLAAIQADEAEADGEAAEGGEDDDGDAETPYSGGGSQYFLITPKLLHGLRYEPGMRVLCIASGEYMPQDQEKVSFKRILEIRRRMNQEAAATAAAS